MTREIGVILVAGRPPKKMDLISKNPIEKSAINTVISSKPTTRNVPENSIPMTCSMCGKSSVMYQRDFISSSNPIHEFLHLVPVCRTCTNLIYGNLVIQYQSEDIALKMLCLRLGIYYNKDIAEGLKEKGSRRIGEYTRKISLPQYQGKTFEDTLFEDGYVVVKEEDDDIEDSEEDLKELDTKHVIYKKTLAMFGDSFTDEDLFYLQTQYADWTRRYECNEKSLEIMIKNICLMDLDIRKSTQNGEDVSKKMTALSKAIIDANLKPVLDGSSDVGEYSLGQYIEKWEDDKPIPVYDDPDFQDKDGILKYIQTWFFGHLSKVFGRHNSYSEMYEQEISKYTVEKPTYADDEELGESVFGENE